MVGFKPFMFRTAVPLRLNVNKTVPPPVVVTAPLLEIVRRRAADEVQLIYHSVVPFSLSPTFPTRVRRGSLAVQDTGGGVGGMLV